MTINLEAETADEIWMLVANQFRDGKGSWQNSRAGKTTELLHTALCIRNPRQRWVSSRNPVLNPAFAFAEVVWILQGKNDSKFLNYFNRSLPKYAGTGEVYDGAYGHRLRNHFGIDQIERAYNVLRENPDSRQVILQIWDVSSDLPNDDGVAKSTDVPCNVCSLLKVRSGKLEWLQIMRSNDVFIGLPYNIIQFTTLHELMASWLGLELGHYHHISDSLHIYEGSIERVISSNALTSPANLDHLSGSYDDTLEVVKSISLGIEQIIDESVASGTLADRYRELNLPQPWLNIASILFAEGLRRRGGREEMEAVLRTCSNQLFVFLFERWLARTAKRERD